jgi:short chain dehydrogenase
VPGGPHGRGQGGLWGVVTCAGVDVPGRLDTLDAAVWERTVAVNLLGTAAVVRAALPYLRSSRGRIVTVASTLGHRAVSDATAYCASKFGVVGFTHVAEAVAYALTRPPGCELRELVVTPPSEPALGRRMRRPGRGRGEARGRQVPGDDRNRACQVVEPGRVATGDLLQRGRRHLLDPRA